jgi:SNF2 family DNA or RNA helicase
MKTDKSIISDLPEKIVTQQYCDLTVKQKMLYEAVLNNALGELENSSGEQQVSSMKRRGLILSMITSLKQICNAPHCYDESVPADADTSGKAQTLLELLSELTAAGRKTIVFTQYTATGELIASWLRDNMNIEADFLHGALSLSQREQMVEKFQSDRSRPVLILSLKAAGTGLNITAASAVIHYDLWWNPAVENQATDRAFRIGQRNNVNVYRFVCEGTFEERIDEMIRAKQELADLTVEAGEKWLSEMSNSEIRELFTLSRNIGDSED